MSQLIPFSPPISAIPQEVIDKIIDTIFYAEDWWPSQWDDLSSCSLVCKSFLPRSRMHMFTNVTLPGEDGAYGIYTKIGSLLELIDARPSIANHIRELSLVIDRGRSMWIYDRPDMIKLMRCITSSSPPLKKLMLSAVNGQQVIHTPVHFMNRFIYPYIAPTITSLRLECLWEVPPQLVFSCLNLQELVLKYTAFRNEEDGTPLSSVQHIHSFGYTGSAVRFSEVYSTLRLNFSNLQRLTIRTDELEDLTICQEIIDATEHTLEELVIGTYEHQRTALASVELNLKDQPRLHTLEQIVHFKPSNLHNLSDICATLKTISTASCSLSSFTLMFYVGHSMPNVRPNSLKNAVLKNAEWETLASEICRIAGSRGFRLVLMIDYVHPVLMDDIRKFGTYKEYEAEARSQCSAVLKAVIDEPLVILKNHPGIIVTPFVISRAFDAQILESQPDQN